MEPVFQTVVFIIALVAMIGILVITPLIPVIPGPALVWMVAVLYALTDRQATLGWIGLIVLTGMMIIGSTANLWVQVFGVKAGRGGCLSAAMSLIAGLVGLVLFPPFGGLIGAVLGAFLTELLIHKDWRQALTAGSGTFGGWLLTTVVEFGFTLAMVIVFVAAVLT